MTPQEFAAAREAFHTQWGEVLRDLKGEIKRAAATERAYRKREAELWVLAPKGEKRGDVTAAERDAWVSGESSDLRYERDIAQGLSRAGFKHLDLLLAEASMLQSELNAFKAEAKAAGYEQ